MDILKVVDVQKPSIDRPFGVALWPIFNALFGKVMGYPADDFRFVREVTPISTFKESASLIIAYYAIIFGGRAIMSNFGAMKLRTLFQLHNLFLTTVSGILLALFIEQLTPTLYNHGLFYGICNGDGGWTQPVVVLYYVCSPACAVLRAEALRLECHPIEANRSLDILVELPHEIFRTSRHCFPCCQEEAFEYAKAFPSVDSV